jgi:hypothetical protein
MSFTGPYQLTKDFLLFFCPISILMSLYTVKSRFNEHRNNEISSTTKFFSGPHQFTKYPYVKMFHFNEYRCNENISLT